MGILTWLIAGMIAAWSAGIVMKDGGYGLIADIIVGIIGALMGGLVSGKLLGVDNLTSLDLNTLLVAFLSSVILLAILRVLPEHRPPKHMHH